MLANQYSLKHPESTETIFEKANEWWVKHGTGFSTPPSLIAENGLDFRYAKHGMFGPGAYTAGNAFYSNSYFYSLNKNEAQMVLCRVAAGVMYFCSNKNINKNGFKKTPEGTDSLLADTEDYENIVTFQKDSIYPAYIITYEK